MSGIVKANERNVRAYWKGVNIYNAKVFNPANQVDYINAALIAIAQAEQAELAEQDCSEGVMRLLSSVDAAMNARAEVQEVVEPATYTANGIVPIENQEIKIA